MVEQWACSRAHPTFIITTYTGDVSQSVQVGVIGVPVDEKAWSPRLKVYFKSLQQYHARRRESRLGTIMVTNLSGFSSSLTVIPIPNGDVRRHRESFVVNENLKRLGCSGRVGMTLSLPSDATQSKFYQLFHTSDKIPLQSSVIELVKLCQVALVLFGELEPEYADGLLCDMTEKALNDWWIDLGTEHYNIEPLDGILGPSTVAALLGLLIGARNRLNIFGAPVSKDVFDIESTKRGIAYFQKSQNLRRSRKFDRQTLDKLHRLTAKAAHGEGWTMPRAVKSTVAELSGKGGDILATRDKIGIAEVETVDIELFVQLVQGERAKWLWHGKPRKSLPGDANAQVSGEDTSARRKDENSRHKRTGKRWDSHTDNISHKKRDYLVNDKYGDVYLDEERDYTSKRTALKKATGRVADAPRSGIGRFKSAVGRKGLQLKQAEDGPASPIHESRPFKPSPLAGDAADDQANERRDITDNEATRNSDYSPLLQPQRLRPRKRDAELHSPTEPKTPLSSNSGPGSTAEQPDLNDLALSPSNEDSQPQHPEAVHDVMHADVAEYPKSEKLGFSLTKTMSLDSFSSIYLSRKSQEQWPRRLSFGNAEESILTWVSLTRTATKPSLSSDLTPRAQSADGSLHNAELQRLQDRLLCIKYDIGTWVDQQIAQVRELDVDAENKQQIIGEIYHSNVDEFHSLQERAENNITSKKTKLQDAVRSIEMLGAKLEYEINTLRGKVEDVEDTVFEFERQVLYVEARMQELENESRKEEGWLGWLLRMFSGIGTGTG